jgi:hypothetical protein
MQSRLLQTSVLRVIERTLLLSELEGGGDSEDKFVSDLFNDVIMRLNRGQSIDFSDSNIDRIDQFIENINLSMENQHKVTKLTQYAYIKYFRRLRDIKTSLATGSGSFDDRIASRLANFIDSMYRCLEQSIIGVITVAEVNNVQRNMSVYRKTVRNSIAIKRFFKTIIPNSIQNTENERQLASIQNTENEIREMMGSFLRMYAQYSIGIDASEYIADKMEPERNKFIGLMKHMKRIYGYSNNKTIDSFFQLYPQNIDSQKPLIKSIMQKWIYSDIFSSLYRTFQAAISANIVNNIQRLCSEIKRFAEREGKDANNTPDMVRHNYHKKYTDLQHNMSTEVFQGLFECYFSYGGWEEFYEKLMTGTMAIRY